jgi:acetyltransferase EpsM
MRSLVIFGAGGLGRELLGWINASSEAFRAKWPVTAFVADNATPDMRCAGLPVRRRSDFASTPRYLLAVGSAEHRRRLANELAALGWEACAWVHETALVGHGVQIGEGSLIFPYDSLASDTKIGRFVLSNGRNIFGHDVTVGDYSVLLGRAWMGGNVAIGENVVVGSSAVIHPGMRIGDGSVVGIGSIVIRHVPAGATVFGNPAKQISGRRR